ncbi:methyl-accepting chemotaxis protein [Rubrivivax albus]|uniref:PAS domain-containing methyl-accepting chemotaxis protein n=1 Tax=Rubrivivax albus TaxID=2499835 RepID=A0A3S2VYJ6_9BURK|nr:PAS domain-containing methyl-accepting chemotaxis protein [Rubrivivax albus]RVT52818.1 PAS domain-containing methyl-accepting chemotaxis protein [Rubrivivax albus]
MRKNLPVTQQEYPLRNGQTLVSVTDLKGRIIHCNQAFAEASGFSAAELLGQPHNLVRHPDMPEEAFRDMWDTIAGGLPWQGLVKNRRKNGDFYWVLANATPIKAGEQITGYLSVRTVPDRAAVQAAEALYARMQQEADSGRLKTGIRRGQVVPLGLIGRTLHAVSAQVRRWGVGGAATLGAVFLSALAAQALPAALWVPGALAMAAAAWVLSYGRSQRELGSLVQDALQLAAGDLAHGVRTGAPGQLGLAQLALSQVGVNLRTTIGDVRAEIDNVRHAAEEIAAGGQDLSARTEAQASSLEQTAASMEQINGTVRGTAQHASTGALLAGSMGEVAQRSERAVQEVVTSMGAIRESSQRISDIIQVIEGIAFQTNILALNAAVEAARAGEAGRGFAVVASEVRALAQRTSQSAKEVRSLIATSSERVDAGVQHTETAQRAMSEALGTVGEVSATLESINAATSEQLAGVGQVTEAVTHLDGVTQQNAAMVEQLAAATGSLQQQVVTLTQAMRLFRLSKTDSTICDSDAVDLRRSAKASAADAALPVNAKAGPKAATAPGPRSAGKPAAAPAPAPASADETEWTAF